MDTAPAPPTRWRHGSCRATLLRRSGPRSSPALAWHLGRRSITTRPGPRPLNHCWHAPMWTTRPSSGRRTSREASRGWARPPGTRRWRSRAAWPPRLGWGIAWPSRGCGSTSVISGWDTWASASRTSTSAFVRRQRTGSDRAWKPHCATCSPSTCPRTAAGKRRPRARAQPPASSCHRDTRTLLVGVQVTAGRLARRHGHRPRGTGANPLAHRARPTAAGAADCCPRRMGRVAAVGGTLDEGVGSAREALALGSVSAYDTAEPLAVLCRGEADVAERTRRDGRSADPRVHADLSTRLDDLRLEPAPRARAFAATCEAELARWSGRGSRRLGAGRSKGGRRPVTHTRKRVRGGDWRGRCSGTGPGVPRPPATSLLRPVPRRCSGRVRSAWPSGGSRSGPACR